MPVDVSILESCVSQAHAVITPTAELKTAEPSAPASTTILEILSVDAERSVFKTATVPSIKLADRTAALTHVLTMLALKVLIVKSGTTEWTASALNSSREILSQEDAGPNVRDMTTVNRIKHASSLNVLILV